VWTIPNGAVIDSGSNGLKIKVKFNTAGTNDSIYVQAYNGCLSSKKVLKLNTSGCATTPKIGQYYSNESKEINSDLDVFPNPTSNKFNIILHSNSNEELFIKIMNVQGRIISNSKYSSKEKLTFGEDLKPGIYLVEIRTGKNKYTKKLIKQ
jgi:hypothetical protein